MHKNFNAGYFLWQTQHFWSPVNKKWSLVCRVSWLIFIYICSIFALLEKQTLIHSQWISDFISVLYVWLSINYNYTCYTLIAIRICFSCYHHLLCLLSSVPLAFIETQSSRVSTCHPPLFGEMIWSGALILCIYADINFRNH